MVFLDIAVFVLASLVLVKSASYAVKSVSIIAHTARFSEFFISFALAGFISIAPEFFIGINSALAGSPEMGLGTILGSNIADMTIVIGIIALLGRRLNADARILSNNAYFLFVTSLPVLFMLDGQISRDDGMILVMFFAFYMFHLVRKEKIFSGKQKIDRKFLAKNVAYFISSMAILFLSARLIVGTGVILSGALLIPPIIIGLFLVAIGTTLPELTFSLRAVLSKHKEIALGDILGNVAIDSTFTIGVIAMISPISTKFSLFATSAFFMIFTAILVAALLRADKKITWKESFFMFLIYVIFAFIELRVIS